MCGKADRSSPRAEIRQIVQHGTQSRSNPTLIRDMKLIHSGFIGDRRSRGYVYRMAIAAQSAAAPGPVPAWLDWSLWRGPAQEKPFYVKTLNSGGKKQAGMWVPYDWHYNWEYGNGEIGNQGVHQMDIACWGHNRGMPTRVHSAGGRFGMNDDGMTPNTQATTFAYADGSILTFEVRNLGSFQEMDGGDCGNSFFGTKGFVVVRDSSPTSRAGWINAKRFQFRRSLRQATRSSASSMPSARASKATSDVGFDAHLVRALPLGSIATVGRSLEFDGQAEEFRTPRRTRWSRNYRKARSAAARMILGNFIKQALCDVQRGLYYTLLALVCLCVGASPRDLERTLPAAVRDPTGSGRKTLDSESVPDRRIQLTFYGRTA